MLDVVHTSCLTFFFHVAESSYTMKGFTILKGPFSEPCLRPTLSE